MEIEIKKAGIISGLFLSYEYEQTDPSAKSTNRNVCWPRGIRRGRSKITKQSTIRENADS